MEGYYYFGEYLRWNLWFPNPNIAGAFVACILAWGFPYLALRLPNAKREWVFYGLLTITAWAAWFVLIKTYSRGAFVSAALVWVFCAVLIFRKKHVGARRHLCLRALLTAGVIFALTVFSGFASRVSPTHLTQDGSVQARGTLWRGAIAMIADAPLTGWGAGQSGQVYMNWYQPLEDERRYGGTVNSYLFVAAEYGLPVLGVVLTCLFGILLLGWRQLAAKPPLSMGAGWWIAGALASVATFALVNLFSTLWIFGVLWWAPCVAVMLILLGLFFRRNLCLLKMASLSVGLAFAVCLLLYLAGICLGGDIPIEKKGDFIRYGDSAEKSAGVLCLLDNTVFGQNVGKAVRRLAEFPDVRGRPLYAPISAKQSIENIEKGGWDTIIASGVRCGQLSESVLASKVIFLLNPLGSPDRDAFARVSQGILVLGSIDEHRQHVRWSVLVQKDGWTLRTVSGGQEIEISALDEIF